MKKLFKLFDASAKIMMLGFFCSSVQPAQANDEKIDSFAYRVSLESQASAAIQRLSIPANALGLFRSRDLSDLRVFNSSNQAVPYAMLPTQVSKTLAVSLRSYPLFPIQVSTQAGAGGVNGDVQLRIEERAGQRIVTLGTEKSTEKKSSSAPAPAPLTELTGYLLDTQDLNGRLDYLEFEADLPIGEPIQISVSASRDLRNWRSLADASPIFRFGGEGAPGNLRVALAGANLTKEYLRITWSSLVGNAAQTFKIKSVKIAEVPKVAAVPKQQFILPIAIGENANEVVTKFSSSIALQALAIQITGTNVLMPVRISVREGRTQPWRQIASTVLYRMTSGASTITNPPVELASEQLGRGGDAVREYKIEADKGAAGFTNNLPVVNAIVDPVEIAFLASGSGPFTLAIGLADAKPLALALSSLIPGYTAGAEQSLALAKATLATEKITPPAPPTMIDKIGDKTGAPSSKSLILWAVLVGGALLMATLVFGLMKKTKPTVRTDAKDQSN